MFLIGNKKDCESMREVSREKAEQFRRENGIHFFFETSAKSGENVENIFIMAAKMLYHNFKDKIT
jgi:Ras-related protein Rab-14